MSSSSRSNSEAVVQGEAEVIFEGLQSAEANELSDGDHDNIKAQEEEIENAALPRRKRPRHRRGRMRSTSRDRYYSRRPDHRRRYGHQDRSHSSSESSSESTSSTRVSSGSSSVGLDQDYRELFSSSAFNTAPWNSPPVPFSLTSEDTESQVQYLRNASINEILPGAMDIPVIEIYDSRYIGNDLLQGPHRAKLTTFHDPKKQRQPLFRWLHFRQDFLNFETLQKNVGRVPLSRSDDLPKLFTLLEEVKQSFGGGSKLTATGRHVSFMEPGYHNVSLDQEDSFGDLLPRQRVATWLCMPYISYRRYSGLAATGDPALYPNQTLMQAHHSQISRDRDMQQAICQTEHAQPGFCLHISQLWCIVVDNSCLITCGEMSLKELQGEAINLVSEPLREPTTSIPSILVSYVDSTWSLPLRDFVPGALPQLLAQNFTVLLPTPRSMPYQLVGLFGLGDFLQGQCYPAHENKLLEFSDLPQPPLRGVLGPQDREASRQKTGIAADLMDQRLDPDFHIFMILGSDDPELTGLESKGLRVTVQNQLKAIDTHLSKQARFADLRAYEACKNKTHQSLLDLLNSRVTPESTKDPQFAELHAECIDIFNATEIIQRFYLPIGIEAPTLGKFWGAIYRIVKAYNDKSSFRPMLRQELRSLTQPIQAFVRMISSSQTDRTKVNSVFIPRQLPQSWVHIVMSLVHFSADSQKGRSHLFAAVDLISEGIKEAVDKLPKPARLLGKSIVLPVDLAAVFSLTLLSNTGNSQVDIRKMYYECIQKLDSEISTKPSDRRLLQTASLLKKELSIVKDVVDTQAWVIHGLVCTSQSPDSWGTRAKGGRNGYYTKHTHHHTRYETYQEVRRHQTLGREYRSREVSDESEDVWIQPLTLQGSTDDPRQPTKWKYGLRRWFIKDIERILVRDSQQYMDLVAYVEGLERTIVANIDLTKDHQELALYAFTIVTVVFLPLSAVASIFGMNTADIREMEVGQWLYWAVALPVTALVVLLGLWWMGELDSVLKLFGKNLVTATVENPAYPTTYPELRHKGGMRLPEVFAGGAGLTAGLAVRRQPRTAANEIMINNYYPDSDSDSSRRTRERFNHFSRPYYPQPPPSPSPPPIPPPLPLRPNVRVSAPGYIERQRSGPSMQRRATTSASMPRWYH